jgi:hypothetical protein
METGNANLRARSNENEIDRTGVEMASDRPNKHGSEAEIDHDEICIVAS